MQRFIRRFVLQQLALLLAVGLASACRTAPPVTTTPAAPVVAGVEPVPNLRLDDRAVPLSYDLRLTIDPAQPSYEGEVAIDLDVRRPTRILWINARGPEIRDARLITQSGEAVATVIAGDANDREDTQGDPERLKLPVYGRQGLGSRPGRLDLRPHPVHRCPIDWRERGIGRLGRLCG